MIGRVSGSQVGEDRARLDVIAVLDVAVAPRHLRRSRSRPLSSGSTTMVALAMTTSRPSAGHVAHRARSGVPSDLRDSTLGPPPPSRRRAADVEGAHRQLRARLADRLRAMTPTASPTLTRCRGQVAAVAVRTGP